MLERNDWLGGAIRTAEITVPGFRHDVFSAWHPLWVGGRANALLGGELAARGLHYLNTELPTASVHDGGEAAFLLRSAPANVAEFERHAAGDGAAWQAFLDAFLPNADISFGLLGTELWSRAGGLLLARALSPARPLRSARVRGQPPRLEPRLARGELRVGAQCGALLAPWVLHTGPGPDAASSGFMTQVIGVAIQEGGMPVPRGGGARLPEALVGLITDSGGECRTGAEVASVLLRDGRAVGVATVEGERLGARRAVIANVTPTQLYGRLLGDPEGAIARAGRRFRFGRSEMQIHFALSEPPRWRGDERLGRTAIVHLTPGLDGVSRAVNEAERGLLPAEATVVCGQPLTVDESRAPGGAGMLWIQLQELPWKVRGDAAGELDVGDGLDGRAARGLRRPDPAPAGPPYHEPGRRTPRAHLTLAGRPRAGEPEPPSGATNAGSLFLDQNFLWRLAPGPARAPLRRSRRSGRSARAPSRGPGSGRDRGRFVASELLRPSVSERLARRAASCVRRVPPSPPRTEAGGPRPALAARAGAATVFRVDIDLLSETLSDEPRYRAAQVWEWTARGASSYAEMTNIPAPLRAALEQRVPFSSLTVLDETLSRDGTLKVLFATAEGHPLEAVLMRYRDGRRSVCVSAQSGCPLTCSFCATGQMRFARNLSASEILDQALHFRRIEPIDHVVFMGMGEPMLNLDAVLAAARRLPELGVTHRRTTISTSRLAPRPGAFHRGGRRADPARALPPCARTTSCAGG